jgi:hypothetical protein
MGVNPQLVNTITINPLLEFEQRVLSFMKIPLLVYENPLAGL